MYFYFRVVPNIIQKEDSVSLLKITVSFRPRSNLILYYLYDLYITFHFIRIY